MKNILCKLGFHDWCNITWQYEEQIKIDIMYPPSDKEPTCGRVRGGDRIYDKVCLRCEKKVEGIKKFKNKYKEECEIEKQKQEKAKELFYRKDKK